MKVTIAGEVWGISFRHEEGFSDLAHEIATNICEAFPTVDDLVVADQDPIELGSIALVVQKGLDKLARATDGGLVRMATAKASRITFCTVWKGERPFGEGVGDFDIRGEGQASCSPLDQFVAAVGRAKALGRALSDRRITPDERTALWEGYEARRKKEP